MPNKIHFTDLALRALPFSNTQATYWDRSFPTFGVRVGRRSKTSIVIRNRGHRLKIDDFAKKKVTQGRPVRSPPRAC
jgi:hypothetical protein